MANEYASAAQLKAYLGITNTSDDALLASCCTAASRAVDGYCGQGFFVATSSAREFRADTTHSCTTDPVSNPSTAVVKLDLGQDGTYETTLTLNTDYFWEPLSGRTEGLDATPATSVHLVAGRYFPSAWYGRPVCQVTAAWGWAAVPDPVYMATLQAAAEMWRRKDSPFGVLQNVEFGPIRLSSDAMRSVSSLLRPYRTGSALAPMA